jgi:serine/threonine-protein kinase
MGVLYRATDQVLSRSVAIKLLPLDRAADPTFVARFEREALAAAALNHPNIVAIYDSARDEDTRFIVMECAAGASLAEVLADEGCLAPEEAVRIATQIADALRAAHGAGVIHRDIKPANVMVDEELRVKVLDFGIARAAADATLTQTDVILGSAPYLAPEIAAGRPADARSDIYALGCVLYALLTGDPPFTGELAAAVMQQHVVAQPRSPRELNPAIPAGLDALVLELLAKDPDARPQTAAALVGALPASLHEEPGTTVLMPRAEPATAVTRAHRRVEVSAGGRRGWPNGALAVALALALVLAVTLALTSAGGSTRAAAKHRVVRLVSHPARHVPTRAIRTRLTTRTTTPPPAPLLSVPDAISALSALVIRDAHSGFLDQHAVDALLEPLQDVQSHLADGHAADALGPAGHLPAQLAQLEASQDIHASAVGPLGTAISQLLTALERATPQGGPPGPAGGKHKGHGPDGNGPPGQSDGGDG